MIRVLSLPSRHPYMSKFDGRGEIIFVNPDTDYFNNYGGCASVDFISKTHPPNSYDLVHIHFSFDRLNTTELEKILDYFDSIKKPIIWTVHSLKSQREKNIEKGQLQILLFSRARSIITLTNGCKNYILEHFGKDKDVSVIPHGYIVDPNVLQFFNKNLINKKRLNFIYLVGDLRKNKEICKSIEAFLKEPDLSDCSLTVLYKPIKPERMDDRTLNFLKVIDNPSRVKSICKEEFSNDFLTALFCESYVCFLPYLWGTHSGQVELCRDCGCYPVISNVGFYKEQWNRVIEFKYDDNTSIFADNFVKALIMTKSSPILSTDINFREKEFRDIIKKHESVYNHALGRQ